MTPPCRPGSLYQSGGRHVEPTEAHARRSRIRWRLEGVADADVAGRRHVRRGVFHQVPPKSDDSILPLGALPVEDRDLAEGRASAGCAAQPPVDIDEQSVQEELAGPDR